MICFQNDKYIVTALNMYWLEFWEDTMELVLWCLFYICK